MLIPEFSRLSVVILTVLALYEAQLLSPKLADSNELWTFDLGRKLLSKIWYQLQRLIKVKKLGFKR